MEQDQDCRHNLLCSQKIVGNSGFRFTLKLVLGILARVFLEDTLCKDKYEVVSLLSLTLEVSTSLS